MGKTGNQEVTNPVTGWQPMETAPRDGTSVLVCTPRTMHVVYWIEKDIEYWHVTDNKHGPFPLRGPSPTHWMPLPEPPE